MGIARSVHSPSWLTRKRAAEETAAPL